MWCRGERWGRGVVPRMDFCSLTRVVVHHYHLMEHRYIGLVTFFWGMLMAYCSR